MSDSLPDRQVILAKLAATLAKDSQDASENAEDLVASAERLIQAAADATNLRKAKALGTNYRLPGLVLANGREISTPGYPNTSYKDWLTCLMSESKVTPRTQHQRFKKFLEANVPFTNVLRRGDPDQRDEVVEKDPGRIVERLKEHGVSRDDHEWFARAFLMWWEEDQAEMRRAKATKAARTKHRRSSQTKK